MPKSSPGQPRTEPDDVDRFLVDLVTGLLADYFFDPDNEAAYRMRYPSGRGSWRRSPTSPEQPLTEATFEQDGAALSWRLDVLHHRNSFRVTMRHPVFAATVEGVWQFQRETLRQARVVQRVGDASQVAEAVEALLAHFSASEPTQEEIDDLLAALSDERDAPQPGGNSMPRLGRNPAPRLGDNPAPRLGDTPAPRLGDTADEPPPATSAERTRARSIVGQLAGTPDREPRTEDRTWLEMTPQTLPVFTDLLVEALISQPRDETRIAGCLDLVTMQLEFVRYRQDRGWDWASRMLNEYQQRLIALGKAGTLDQADWFAMAAALTEARVPVSGDVQLALADAGLSADATKAPMDDLLAALRGLSDELAEMVTSPFEVLEALNAASAIMPAALRSFMATELALSSHAVLREAVPLMLMDGDPGVRRAAAAAMQQTAGEQTVSPDWLRRAITMRNWIPQADRAELDRAIRKARHAGVPIGPWPAGRSDVGREASGNIAFHASMVDGSGAQCILAFSRNGRKGMVAGVLLKHGVGVKDAWLDAAVSRRSINKMLRDMKSDVPSDEVDRAFVDAAVQHAIATGLANGAVPAERLLLVAESLEDAEWKDRRLDVAAEVDRLFARLDMAERTPASIEAALQRGASWMLRQPIAASWFEDDQNVRRVIGKVPPKNIAGAVQLVLSEILPGSRMAWAERFLLMAMWCQAATTQLHRDWATDFVILTQALAGSRPLETIPIMNSIAAQTVMAARTGGW